VNSQTIIVEGKRIQFGEVSHGKDFIKARNHYGKYDGCPLCHKQFVPALTSSVIIVIPSGSDMPNCFLHKECVEGKSLKEVWKQIELDYENAQDYKHWWRPCRV
jgi:hypothetical protein